MGQPSLTAVCGRQVHKPKVQGGRARRGAVGSQRGMAQAAKKKELPFTVKLEGDQGADGGEAKCYKFGLSKGGADRGEGPKHGGLTVWRGQRGSRYAEGLFGEVSLPGDRDKVRFHRSHVTPW